ncbi:hypothetical protein QGM71_20495 [Virgibacillus sp. C22-A2]|uniref:Uncharacterized protein n=1 Tax=Virgibacillus tibetensis TaxID=3042313 RepID=A0ABU6KMP6_9BACI|nr:hypothetical protein [Virgibacillus sp. C22-A2]
MLLPIDCLLKTREKNGLGWLKETKRNPLLNYTYLNRNDNAWFASQLNFLPSNINTGNTNLLRKRDKQILIYMKGIVYEGIIQRKITKIYYWLSYAVDKLELRNELPYLEKTKKYIEKHQEFLEKIQEKNRVVI